MRAGKLRELVELQQRTAATGSMGGKTTSWARVTDVWAQFEPVTGGDGIAQGAQRTVTRYKVTIRYRPIDPAEHRLVWNGVAYGILSALPDERRTYVIIDAEAGRGSSG